MCPSAKAWRIGIGPGNVTRSEWQQKSGNALFDNAVKSAVQKAAPFPQPPQFLVSQLGHDGVALKFRP